MKRIKGVILGALLALAVVAAPADPAVDGGWKTPRRLGVGLTVGARWIAVEGYYSVSARGAAAREQAWAGGAPSRGATRVRVVRLGGVPNLVGGMRQAVVAVRALGGAADAVARRVLGLSPSSDDGGRRDGRGRDADRR